MELHLLLALRPTLQLSPRSPPPVVAGEFMLFHFVPLLIPTLPIFEIRNRSVQVLVCAVENTNLDNPYGPN